MYSKNNRGHMSGVDELIEKTPLDLVLAHYGLPLSNKNGEHRMKCVFNESCSDSQYGNLSVKSDSAKRIYSHCCGVKGNLLTLLHGLEKRQPPSGGRLRGQEFKDALAKLKEINGVSDSVRSQMQNAASGAAANAPDSKDRRSEIKFVGTDSQSDIPQAWFNVNTPLNRHEKEAARTLANLNEELVVDTDKMSPAASAYVRKRASWLQPELMRKWSVGWIPGNGRSLFRKNYVVFTHRNTRGEIVSYSGRDVNFESKWDDWIKAGKPEGKKPNKHCYVSGFKRGAELYGAHSSRLKEPHVLKSLQENGLVVVEGMTDVIRLDELNVCAVGICSNRATPQQIEMIAKFANRLTDGKVLLFPDNDDEGVAGFKDLLWALSIRKADASVCAQFNEVSQPEDLVDWN